MNLSKKDIENIIEEHFLLKDHLIVTNITFNYKDDSGNYPPYDERSKTLREIDGATIKGVAIKIK